MLCQLSDSTELQILSKVSPPSYPSLSSLKTWHHHLLRSSRQKPRVICVLPFVTRHTDPSALPLHFSISTANTQALTQAPEIACDEAALFPLMLPQEQTPIAYSPFRSQQKLSTIFISSHTPPLKTHQQLFISTQLNGHVLPESTGVNVLQSTSLPALFFPTASSFPPYAFIPFLQILM